MKFMIRFTSGLFLALGLMGSAQASPFFKEHRMVFFFASTCPHCHTQAPILKQWALREGALVDAYSFDGKPLPSFPNARPTTKELVDAAFQGQNIRYPATFVLNEGTGALYPVATGALNGNELNARMQALIPKIMTYEARGQR